MNILLCFVIGFASGVLAAMGLGGGFVLVVYLALFTDIGQLEAQSINLLFFIPITLTAVYFHCKNRLMDISTALTCGLLGIPAVAAGFYAARYLGGERLRQAFALFVILCGLKDLFGRTKLDKGAKT